MNNVQEAGNTIGNIPIKWYDKYDHIGYDLNGEKIMRPKSLDAIDKYIHSHDKNERLVESWNVTSRWTIYDEKEGKEIHLTPRQDTMMKLNTFPISQVKSVSFRGRSLCLRLHSFLQDGNVLR